MAVEAGSARMIRIGRLRDAYGRPFTNLRLAVTAECNYRCIFCHIEGEPIGGPARIGTLPPRITPEEYSIIAEAAYLLGAEAFKITGGEPLVRRDIVEIVNNIKHAAPEAEVSMTTNGYLLPGLVGRLANAGLSRINVSIHSLRREVYKFITGVDGLERALKGIGEAFDQGLGLKINMVVLKGINENEIWDLAEFAANYGAVLQLIELHPVGLGARFFKKYFYPLSRVERELQERGARVKRRSLHNRPIYELPDGVRIEVVRPYANPFFCAGCTRIRVGPFGDLSPCLNWKGRRPNVLAAIRRANRRKEKVLAAAKMLVEVNMLRRPYFLAGLNDGFPRATGRRDLRLRVPKRAEGLSLIRELERLLLEGGSP